VGDPAKIQRAVDQNANARVAVLFESAERQAAFFTEAAALKTSRLAKAEFATLDADFLARLASVDERRAKATVTLPGDHFYVDRVGEILDGPLVRGSPP
jgi:uncharacterized protein YaeQ